jgi:hypothetical protein
MEAGIEFYAAGGCLYTASHIPQGCFSGPRLDLEKQPKPQAPEPVAQYPRMPGSFTLEIQEEKQIRHKVKGRKKDIVWKKSRKQLLKNQEYH